MNNNIKGARAVLNSKSSNTHIQRVNKNKKSWSSGEVVDKSKKRGVYVEKRGNAANNRPAEGETEEAKPQAQAAVKRPRRGQKGFLNSVLTILQQDSTATQFPESAVLRPNKKIRLRKRVTIDTSEVGTQDLDAAYDPEFCPKRELEPEPITYRPRTPPPTTTPYQRPSLQPRLGLQNYRNTFDEQMQVELVPPPKKLKFRSRALRENFDDRVVVLQHKKEICNSSSYASTDCTGSKIMDIISKQRIKIEQAIDEKLSVASETKAVDRTHFSENSEVGSKKSLYNFFVNLLQTTLSSYEEEEQIGKSTTDIDAKIANQLTIREKDWSTEIKIAEQLEKDEKIRKVEIDETLASNLRKSDRNWQNDANEQDDVPVPVIDVQGDKQCMYGMDKVAVYEPVTKRAISPPIRPPPVNPRRTQEFIFRPRTNALAISNLTKRVPVKWNRTATGRYDKEPKRKQGKTKTKHSRKDDDKNNPLLNMLKKELMIGYKVYEEPVTMFEALQSIARDKERTRRAIQRAEFTTTSVIGDERSECLLKNKRSTYSRADSTRASKKGKSGILKPIKSEPTPIKINVPTSSNKGLEREFIDEHNQEYFNLIYDDSFADSAHSIKVQGFDYNYQQGVKFKEEKAIVTKKEVKKVINNLEAVNDKFFSEYFDPDMSVMHSASSSNISRILVSNDFLDK